MALPGNPVNEGGRTIKVLVVDDSATMRRFLETVLSAVGFACVQASDGAEGFDLFIRDGADLIITDLMMPRVDGYQFLAAIGLLPAWRRPPVIVLSGRMDEQKDLKRPELKLASALLQKPMEPEVLLRAVVDVMERARAGK